MIQVTGLTKSYGAVRALDGVGFNVRSGEVVGFLGPNGAGKTTTMKILTGFLMADEGKAEVDGLDVATRPVEVKRLIGYLPESTPLYTEMVVEDYLDFIADVREIPKNQRRSAIDRVAKDCGLTSVLWKTIGELSKGFRQRVGLAQAMIHDPKILILDEPTVGLDPNQIAEIRDLIRALGREKTVILSTHILSEVAATCGRVMIIAGGKIVADGSVENIVKGNTGDTIQLVWRAPLEEGEKALRAVSAISEIREKGNEGPYSRFTLSAQGGPAACEELFSLAASKGWRIAELHRESASLEDVFRQLTKEGRS